MAKFQLLFIVLISVAHMAIAVTLREAAMEFLSSGVHRKGQHPIKSEMDTTLIACSDELPCPGEHRVCNRGECQCPNPTEQNYYSIRSRCEVEPGRACNPERNIPCWGSATCQPDSYSRTGYSCTCPPPLESDGYYCTNGYMGVCSRSWSSGEEGCNYGAVLGCYESKCQCEFDPDHVFDPIKKRCVSRLGFLCLTIENVGYFDCATGLVCKRRPQSTDYPLVGFCALP